MKITTRIQNSLFRMLCLLTLAGASQLVSASDLELPDREPLTLPELSNAPTELYVGASIVQTDGFKPQPGFQIQLIQNLPDSRCFVAGLGSYAATNSSLNSRIANQEIDDSGGFSTTEVGIGCYPFGSWRRHWLDEPVKVDFFVTSSLGYSRFLGEGGNVFSFGGGLRFTRADGAALRINLTDHLFQRTMLGQESREHALMLGLSVGILF